MKIQEIARLAGVSASTVSRVFANHENVKKDVRDKVFALARQHGYHPRLTDKQRNVVVITPYNNVYPVQSCVDMLLMALAQELPAHGFRLEILPLNNLERLNSIQFCAAVAIGVEADSFSAWDEQFASPLILVDRMPPDKQHHVFAVRSDEAQGMELAIAHLYERGCRNIGCIIHGEKEMGNAGLRYDAIVRALKTRALPLDGRILFSGSGSDKYVELTGKLLRNGVDALFCPGGNAGIVLLYALSLYGKRVPDDISLIASEQTFFSQYAVPPQTTVTQDYQAVAKQVSNVIEDCLDNQDVLTEYILPYKLMIRESVRSCIV